MPELPEVETIARNLRPQLVGRTIISAQVLWPRTIETPSAQQFPEMITGQEILDVRRRAKYLHVVLFTYHLFIHLRMSGDLTTKPAGAGRVPVFRLLPR